MDLFASYGMQYMKQYYINESLKSTQNKKKRGGGVAFLHRSHQFLPFPLQILEILCVPQTETPFQWLHYQNRSLSNLRNKRNTEICMRITHCMFDPTEKSLSVKRVKKECGNWGLGACVFGIKGQNKWKAYVNIKKNSERVTECEEKKAGYNFEDPFMCRYL